MVVKVTGEIYMLSLTRVLGHSGKIGENTKFGHFYFENPNTVDCLWKKLNCMLLLQLPCRAHFQYGQSFYCYAH